MLASARGLASSASPHKPRLNKLRTVTSFNIVFSDVSTTETGIQEKSLVRVLYSEPQCKQGHNSKEFSARLRDNLSFYAFLVSLYIYICHRHPVRPGSLYVMTCGLLAPI